VAFAARRAKELGGDAIIVLHQGTEYAGTVGSSSFPVPPYALDPIANTNGISLLRYLFHFLRIKFRPSVEDAQVQ
jgi:hypothetical protein